VGRKKIEGRGGEREGDISSPHTPPPSATSCPARSFLALPGYLSINHVNPNDFKFQISL